MYLKEFKPRKWTIQTQARTCQQKLLVAATQKEIESKGRFQNLLNKD